MVNHNILLNVKQAGPLDTGIEVTQGDYGQVQFLMRVKDDDAFITNATEAKMVFNIPSGYIVEGDASISAGTYTYVFKGNELQSAGKIATVLTLTLPGGRVSSCGFTFNCRYNPLFDRGIDAGPYLSELENIKQQAQAQVDYLNALIQQLQGDLGETVLTRADLVNNALATTPGIAALDAVMGKTLSDKDANLQQQITQLNSNFGTSNGKLVVYGSDSVNGDRCAISAQSKSDNKNLLLNYQENTDILSFDYYNGSTWKGRTKLLTNSDLYVINVPYTSANTESNIDNFYNNFSASLPEYTWYRGTVSHGVIHSILGGGTWYLEGYKTTAYYEWQCIRSYSETGIRMFARSKYDGTWKPWVVK